MLLLYKNVLCSGVRYRAPRGAPHRTLRTGIHSAIVHTSSSSGHVIIKPASTDEHLLVHPCDAKFHLVLTVEPATLQAATLMQATRDASVDRCPPAATLQLPVGGWSVGCCSRGPSARLNSHKPACLPPEPSHSRPLAAIRKRVPPVSAHVGYVTVQGANSTSLRKPIADANGKHPGNVDTGR